MAEHFPLETIPLFRNLPAAQHDALDRAMVRQLYKSGETIFRQGEPPEFIYVVESGGVDVLLPSEGKEIILASFAEGSFFGEMAIFDKQPRNATARANDDTALICIPGSAVEALFDSYPMAARQFIGVIALRLRGANEMLARLQIQNVNEVADERMTFGERIADGVARFGGSWTFILIFGVFLLCWMAVNTAWVLTRPPDPFPYIFLNLILSCVAAMQAPVIMMSQNRQSIKDRLQADLDYQVNIKAEHAIQQLHRKIDELRATLLQRRAADDGKPGKK
jgi:CRP/FNR family cyclic AMP-dependent transcriptional regulator